MICARSMTAQLLGEVQGPARPSGDDPRYDREHRGDAAAVVASRVHEPAQSAAAATAIASAGCSSADAARGSRTSSTSRRWRPVRSGASTMFEQVLDQLMFNPLYKPIVAQCEEIVVHWGAPANACKQIEANPQTALDDLDALASVRMGPRLAGRASRAPGPKRQARARRRGAVAHRQLPVPDVRRRGRTRACRRAGVYARWRHLCGPRGADQDTHRRRRESDPALQAARGAAHARLRLSAA